MPIPDAMRQLAAVLQHHRPGPEIRQAMAPSQRRNNPMAEDRAMRTAGVLMLLYREQNAWHMPLIVRSRYEGPHSGQIALPGGRSEPGDPDLWHTATRESEEEVGVARNGVQRIGVLPSIFIPNSRYEVTPYIGWVDGTVQFRPAASEVAEVLPLPLDLLLDPQWMRRDVWKIRGQDIEVPYYQFGPHRIWGATAMMLSEFLYCWGMLQPRQATRSF